MTEPQAAEFKGEKFRLNEDVSEWAFLEFAEAAEAGEDGNSMQGMASLLRFVLELVHPEERDRFRLLARRKRASTADLLEFLGIKIEADAERPTEPSADSSHGQTVTVPKSGSHSDIKDLAASGPDFLRTRPDLALIAHDARKAG